MLSVNWDPLNPKNTPNSPDDALDASLLTQNWQALAATWRKNHAANGTFDGWSRGNALAPDYYTLEGAGAAILRIGVGQTPTDRKIGDFAAQVTAGAGAVGGLKQRIVPASSWSKLSPYLTGQPIVTAVAFVKTSSAAAARVGLNDGVSTQYSSYHSGAANAGPDGDGWDPLVAIGQLDAGATEIYAVVEGNTGTVFQVDGVMVLIGPVYPFGGYYIECENIVRQLRWVWQSDVETGDDALDVLHPFYRPGITVDCDTRAVTAPSGGPLTVQLAKNGTDDVYDTTLPGLTDGQSPPSSQLAPNGTYANRCFARGDDVRLDIDAANGAAGLNVTLAVKEYIRPFEGFLAPGDVD